LKKPLSTSLPANLRASARPRGKTPLFLPRKSFFKLGLTLRESLLNLITSPEKRSGPEGAENTNRAKDSRQPAKWPGTQEDATLTKKEKDSI
jgi:hypothetical protein